MDRKQMLQAVESATQWDILVIGGGASGLGTALDASTRGYCTLLLEKGDFAQGTSSRSTKLIHGGIRYLPQGRISFLRHSLRERALLLQNAPHLVRPQAFVLPCSNSWEKIWYSAGIKLYDFLAGKHRLNASFFLSREELLKQLPTVNVENFKGGVCYYDSQFDDSRLAVNLAQTIVEQGGTPLNYVEVVGFLKSQGRVVGVQARDLESKKDFEIQAKVVINATGSFVDRLRKIDEPGVESTLVLSQGSHIVISRDFFPSDTALIMPKADCGRVLFIIPWHNRVLIGTTDTIISAPCSDPKPRDEEVDELLNYASQYLNKRIVKSDLCSTFAGIRALIKPKHGWKGSAQLGRDHALFVSDSQLVSLAGGKWTTYRQMGEDTINTAAKIAGLPYTGSVTQQLCIHGGEKSVLQQLDEWAYYGSDRPLVKNLAKDPSELKKFHPDLPCRAVDVKWAVRMEMARSVQDVLSRRCRCLLMGAKESMSIAQDVADIMASELAKDDTWASEQVESFQKFAACYLPNVANKESEKKICSLT